VTVGAFGAQQRALVRERCEFTTVRPVPVRGHDHDADGAGQEADELDRCAQPAAPHGLSNRSRTYRKAATQESSARKSKEFSGRGSSYFDAFAASFGAFPFLAGGSLHTSARRERRVPFVIVAWTRTGGNGAQTRCYRTCALCAARSALSLAAPLSRLMGG
jgi:hypothetical protein